MGDPRVDGHSDGPFLRDEVWIQSVSGWHRIPNELIRYEFPGYWMHPMTYDECLEIVERFIGWKPCRYPNPEFDR